jgi:hypothetical protein
MKGEALVRLPNGELRRAELHWYEAHGVGKPNMKIKKYLDKTMAERKKAGRRYVVCIGNKGNEASLERNKLYVMIPDRTAK